MPPDRVWQHQRRRTPFGGAAESIARIHHSYTTLLLLLLKRELVVKSLLLIACPHHHLLITNNHRLQTQQREKRNKTKKNEAACNDFVGKRKVKKRGRAKINRVNLGRPVLKVSSARLQACGLEMVASCVAFCALHVCTVPFARLHAVQKSLHLFACVHLVVTQNFSAFPFLHLCYYITSVCLHPETESHNDGLLS